MGQFETVAHSLFKQVEQVARRDFPKESGRMYAIAFDLDTQALEAAYGKPAWRNAYADVKAVLVSKGFIWQQGSVYFGDETMTAVKCVLAAQVLGATLPWFKTCVRDLRMLRIEEMNDLMPALQL